MVRMPNALHFGASSSAMAPMPKTPTVLLCSNFAGKRAHSRAACARNARGISRASASIEPMAASDTGAP